MVTRKDFIDHNIVLFVLDASETRDSFRGIIVYKVELVGLIEQVGMATFIIDERVIHTLTAQCLLSLRKRFHTRLGYDADQ